ncbi:MAG: hypothetical protein WC220_09525 [Pedobacter sp.]|jgi:hypothetical protein
MYSEARKLHLIEEVLKIRSEATLSALEDFLKKAGKGRLAKKEPAFQDFSGIWSKDEAEEMERIIAESCETIHPDDWR